MSDPELVAEVAVGVGRCAVWLKVRSQGRDLQVTIGGGEAHVGAVALFAPPAVISANLGADLDAGPGAGPGAEPFQSLVVVPPHKEGPLAEEAARRLATAARCSCVAIAGIHQDDATRDEIADIVANVRSGLAELELKLSAARRACGRDLAEDS